MHTFKNVAMEPYVRSTGIHRVRRVAVTHTSSKGDKTNVKQETMCNGRKEYNLIKVTSDVYFQLWLSIVLSSVATA